MKLGTNRQLLEPLTPRERDILQRVVAGQTNAQIAEQLVLSAETVKWYVKQLYGKLAAHSRADAIRQAVLWGLVPDPAPAEAAAGAGYVFINPLPQDVAGRYVGHSAKLAHLAALLAQPARLITILGRAGAGKTALACQALADLRQGSPPGAAARRGGVICLSTLGTGITLHRVFADLGRVLPPRDQAQVAALARNTDLAIPQKIAVALERLADRRIILLLDNLETLQHPTTGTVLEPGIQQFIEMSLTQSSALTLLVTSRAPLALPRPLTPWEQVISLEDGLPLDDAVQLLRTLDPAGVTGLRDAPAADLRAVADRVGSFPRALESVAGMLLEDPLLQLADVLQNLQLLDGEISAAVVAQALAALPAAAIQILAALAIFGQPVRVEALAFVLAPFLPEATLRPLLRRLIRACFVKVNRSTQLLALHSIDQTYCYAQLPPDPPGGAAANANPPPFSRQALHRRAAAYYRGRRLPQARWRTLADVDPQIQEATQLVRAGEADAAARVMLEIDRDHLWEWGYTDLLDRFYASVEPALTDPRVAHQVARRRAWLRFFDPTADSDQVFVRLLESAQRQGFGIEEADAWDDLAQIHRRGNRNLPLAIAYHTRALTLYRQSGERRGEAEALGGLGAVYVQIAPATAIGYLREAAAIQRTLGHANSLTFVLTMLGAAYSSLGAREPARQTLHEAIQIAEEARSLVAVGRAYGELARLYAVAGEVGPARAALDTALALSGEISGLPMTASLMFAVCQAAIVLALGQQGTAGLALLEHAIQIAPAAGPGVLLMGRFALSLVRLLGGEIAEARRALPYEAALNLARWSEQNCWVIVLFIKTGEVATARTLLQGLLAGSPEDSPPADTVTLTGRSPLIRATAYAGWALLQQDATLVAPTLELTREIVQTRLRGWEVYRALIESLLQEPNGAILAPLRPLLESRAPAHDRPR
jgi:DNA-binding CsgD family transcriptional regulator/tetratricopeptide (TPR) repeat protein